MYALTPKWVNSNHESKLVINSFRIRAVLLHYIQNFWSFWSTCVNIFHLVCVTSIWLISMWRWWLFGGLQNMQHESGVEKGEHECLIPFRARRWNSDATWIDSRLSSVTRFEQLQLVLVATCCFFAYTVITVESHRLRLLTTWFRTTRLFHNSQSCSTQNEVNEL